MSLQGTSGEPPSMTRSSRVLLADDDQLAAVHTETALKNLGYSVVARVSDGRQAIERAAQGGVDVAILDIAMPVVDGLSAAEQIADPLGIGVVMLTAYHDRAMVERAMAAGAASYVLKPVRPEQLRVAIEVAVAQVRRLQASRTATADMARKLEDYKLAQQAKWLIVARYNVSEPDAWAMLQKASRATHAKLADMARKVIQTGKLPQVPSVQLRLERAARSQSTSARDGHGNAHLA